MKRDPARLFEGDTSRVLRVYLLGQVELGRLLVLQRELVDEVAIERDRGALVLCEHPPAISIGRHGSSAQIHFDLDDLRARRWPLRWLPRGGGCLLHLPGQLAIYPVLALDALGLRPQRYLDLLHHVLRAVLDDFSVQALPLPGRSGLFVADRPVATVGVGVRDWVTQFGAVLNVSPDLSLLRHVRTGPQDPPMTSLERERRGPVRPALVRDRLLEHFQAGFPYYERVTLFSHHPLLGERAVPAERPARSAW